MNKDIKKLQEFFKRNTPVLMVNTSTDRALVCLSPEFKKENMLIFMHFESMNERGGNSVFVKKIHKENNDTLYFENEDENILMLQKINPSNYKHYIVLQYANAMPYPSFIEYGRI